MESKSNSLILGAALVLATATTLGISIPQAMAQSPPISVVGNPHGFSTGPPIPSCQIIIAGSQGPLNGGHIEGCRGTP
jgi:hypothetical protein